MRAAMGALLVPVHVGVIALFIPLGLMLALAPWVGSVGMLLGYGGITFGLILGLGAVAGGQNARPGCSSRATLLVAATGLGGLLIFGQVMLHWLPIGLVVMTALAILGAAAALVAPRPQPASEVARA